MCLIKYKLNRSNVTRSLIPKFPFLTNIIHSLRDSYHQKRSSIIPSTMSYESSPSNCESKFAQNSNLNGDPHKYMIQKSLPKLIQKIAQEASTNNNWAPALRAAPAAISVMATCLVASTSKVAGAIEVNPTGVIPGGEEIKLPHKYLSTNLQYCSDLGRIAFSEAQNSMHRLRGYAEYMTDTDGLISNILEMLEDEDAARYNLRTAMEDLQENADRCKKETNSIKGKFQMLLDFIMALQNAAIEKQNDTQIRQKQNSDRVRRRDEERKAHIARIEFCRGEVERLKEELSAAHDDWRKSKETVDGLALVSSLDAVVDIDDEVIFKEPEVKYEAPQENVGYAVGFKHSLFGKSASRKADEERGRKEAKEDHEKRQKNERARYDEKLEKLLQKRQHELNVAKEEAQERLKTAQTTFEMVQTKLEHAKTELSVTKEQHLQAKLDLDASQADLEALANEKIELKDILAIIESSIKSLKQMKQYVDDMCEFFKEVSTEVQNTMDGPMHKFLTKIDNAAIASGNRKGSREIENLNVDQVNKGQLAQAALRLQGKLSIIGDVAGVYVSISKLYIKPGINKMEGLTYLSHSEYTLQLAEFKEWCSNSVEEIEGFSRKQTRIMIDRMAVGVRAVARETLAIESST
ncbi:hypothetical protein TWF102_008731 [Orbilia oligospora]|uniref:Uncharacterized protein n=1 Tax=Orbilia oligospora TaxID=2813651 RepID=A0A7C8J629_ORBOL|nr:hypothetical protein TWF102_008731 [Orbilia oligospora]KAF3091892.1 hypothetical protein TWF103_011451 [Orbilia oligospora]KAF3143938.1 hypothetical protein TWF594_005005 [Orbilia oligospora]